MNDSELEQLFAPAIIRPLPAMAFSLDDVVHKAAVVRRRRRAAIASVVAVVLILGGGFAALRPGGRPAAQVAAITPEQRTGQMLDYMLSAMPVPAGAQRLYSPPVAALSTSPGLGLAIHRVGWWTAPAAPAAVWATLAHSPVIGAAPEPGLVGAVVLEATSGDLVASVNVVKLGAGSALRIDLWGRPAAPRPTRTLLSSTVRSLSMTTGSLSSTKAYSSTLTLTFASAKVQVLAQALNELPLRWETSGAQCVTTDSRTFTFHDRGRTFVFGYEPTCGLVTEQVDGVAQPSLTSYSLSLARAVAALVQGLPG